MMRVIPHRRCRTTLIVIVMGVLLSGCALWRPSVAPIRVLAEPARCATPVDTLIVMLPGSYSLPEEFQRESFVKILRARHLAADLVLVDAHVGYYRNRSIVDRLAEDVIRPARARGYRHVWIAGISIGAVGAMLYANVHPDDVDGVVLIAPYLGSQLTAKAVRIAGGLQAWPAPEAVPSPDLDSILWPWLQSQTAPGMTAVRKLPIFLGYGEQDRFAYNDEVLAAELPSARVFTTPGGHDWPPWTVLWKRLVEALTLPIDASCRAE